MHNFLSKEGAGGQLGIVHFIQGILIEDSGAEHYFWAQQVPFLFSAFVRKHKVTGDMGWEGSEQRRRVSDAQRKQ